MAPVLTALRTRRPGVVEREMRCKGCKGSPCFPREAGTDAILVPPRSRPLNLATYTVGELDQLGRGTVARRYTLCFHPS